MHISDLLQFVDSSETFIKFANALVDDFLENRETWENPYIDEFVGHLGGWVEGMWFYRNTGQDLPRELDWKFITRMFLVSTVFESGEQELNRIGLPLQFVKDNKTFAKFTEALSEDFTNCPDHWKNQAIDSYLRGMSAWVEEVKDNYQHLNTDNWNFLATILYVGKIYE